MTPDDVRRESRGPAWKRIAWFVGLWAGSVALIGVVAYGIRLVLIG
ncbi:DUF2474 domain-containing protein [Jiella marina]|nr:DUF2474 domain-containing protein [Jiella sp. LLJ827]MCQ0986558.1 DUF2474 domain-containing protein [Jiella sp. LLJ827]